MNDIQKTLQLAEISFEGENFQDSYKKFSEAVEIDISSTQGWIGKGLSSAHLAEPSGNKFKEASVCLRKATEYGVNEGDTEKISKHILLSANDFLKKCNQKVSSYLLEKEKKPMATGELYAVRNVGLIADRYTAFNEEWSNYKLAIEFAFTSLDYQNTNERKEGILNIIDFIYTESKSHFHKNTLEELASYRSKILALIKESDPTFSKQKPKSNDGGGCFIATAVYGDYNAPEVIELRDFRDTVLMKNFLGKILVRIYYRFSPYLALIIKEKEILKKISYLTIISPTTKIWLLIKNNENKKN